LQVIKSVIQLSFIQLSVFKLIIQLKKVFFRYDIYSVRYLAHELQRFGAL